jgi:hypothetical protein
MSGVCDPDNSIGNFTPNQFLINLKNVDFVTLTTKKATTTEFTVDGDPIFDSIASSFDKVQNQTAASNQTTFTGTVQSDGVTSPTTLTFNSTFLNVVNAADFNDIFTTPVAFQLSNTSSTTLSGFIFQTTAAAPPSYTAQANWYIGRSATTNNALNVSFRNAGIGSTSNFVSIAPFNSSGLDIFPTTTRVNTLFQVAGITVPPKTTFTTQTISSSTLIYPFNFSSVSGCRRVIFHAIDVIRPGTGTPLIQVGQTTNYITNTANAYQGVTGGNNGAAEVAWANTTPGGIYLWNATTSAAGATFPTDIVVEFSYMHNDPGYQVWAVTGFVALTGTSTTKYFNFLSGTINMALAGSSTFSGVRLNFPAAPTSGFINVLAF